MNTLHNKLTHKAETAALNAVLLPIIMALPKGAEGLKIAPAQARRKAYKALQLYSKRKAARAPAWAYGPYND